MEEDDMVEYGIIDVGDEWEDEYVDVSSFLDVDLMENNYADIY